MTSRAHELYKQIVEANDPATALEALVDNKQPETEYLEFKGAGKIKDTDVKKLWSKTLSAFANTDGGVLIWGIDAKPIDDLDNPGRKVDGAGGFKAVENPDAFIQLLKDVLLQACVEPVQGVEYFAAKCGEGDVVICLIPQGNHKPYRAESAGHQYYQRVGDNSVVISHSLLRSLFYPTSSASLCVEAKLQKPYSPQADPEFREVYCWLRNQGTATAREIFVCCHGWVSDGIVKASFPWEKGWSQRLDSNDRPVGVTYDEPLHPGEEVLMCRLPFRRPGMFLRDNTPDTYPLVSNNFTGKLTFFVADHPAQTFRVEFSETDIRIGSCEKRFDPVAEDD